MVRANNWMGDLLAKYPKFGDIPINRLLIPGSHDSGTCQMSRGAKTQQWTIAEQLENGMRYLDIRPKVHNHTYYIHHTETGPDGSADLGHYSSNIDPDSATNNKYIFKQIRDFLKEHPKEILILKFQNYNAFGEQDYPDFIDLIRTYLTIDMQYTACQLARFDQGTGEYIAKQTINSLLGENKRVFVVWSTTDVPTTSKGKQCWDFAFPFTPSLTQEEPYALWDPYWHDDSDKLANDDTAADFKKWWDWHDGNLKKWANNPRAGFFVLQSQMQQLPVGDAHASAKRNNAKNMSHYIDLAKAGNPMNVMTFDFVEHGSLCSKIIDYYVEKFESP